MPVLRSYALLVTWQALRLKTFLPLAIVVQALFSFGIVVGYPLLFPSLDETTILYLATGAPAISLITMGLSNQEIAERTMLSLNSIKSYIRSAYRKIDVDSRSKAVLWGIAHGLRADRIRVNGSPAQGATTGA